MDGYAFELALKGLRRFPKSSILAIGTVALGLAAAMTSLTLLHVLASDPLPGRSQHLYSPYVDTVQAKPDDTSYSTGQRAWQRNLMKPDDVAALLAPDRSVQQTLVVSASATVSVDGGHPLQSTNLLLTTSSFAGMFGLPLLQGRFWAHDDDQAHARVAVISADLAQKLFARSAPIGKLIHIGKADFEVIGVSANYHPQPHFYTMNQYWTFAANQQDDVYLPQPAASDAAIQPSASGDCDAAATAGTGLFNSGPSDPARCEWQIPWVQLDTPAQVSAYQDFIAHYAADHRPSSRYGRPSRQRLSSVAGWMRVNHVIPDQAKLNVWLASAFLLLCMVNVAGLLTARFLRRSQEVSIRRAIGASRRAIFGQYLLESCGFCVLGGLLSLPLIELGLWILRQQSGNYNALAHFDASMFAQLWLFAIAVGLVVGLIPAWRATRIAPSLYLKAA